MAKTILIVDDSPTELKLMRSALAEKGFYIMTATDGEEVFAKIAAMKPDVVLLDIVMPKKNGYQICRQLKTTPETKDIRVVLVTSKSQDTDRFWGMRQGADAYLTKPFKPEELTELVTRY